jgi:hypothetical protein
MSAYIRKRRSWPQDFMSRPISDIASRQLRRKGASIAGFDSGKSYRHAVNEYMQEKLWSKIGAQSDAFILSNTLYHHLPKPRRAPASLGPSKIEGK